MLLVSGFWGTLFISGVPLSKTANVKGVPVFNGAGWLNRHTFKLCEGRADNSNGSHFEHILLTLITPGALAIRRNG